MSLWTNPPPHRPSRCGADVEADVRVLMAKMASIQPRGFDSIREREVLHRRIDGLLDEFQMYVAVESLTSAP